MNNTLTIRLIIILLSLTTSLSAQIVNVGKAYLSEHTVMASVSDFHNLPDAFFYNDGRIYFYNDFRNDGVFDYYTPSAYSIFAGQNPQIIKGSHSSYFYNINFNNALQTGAIQLNSDVFIDGNANFHHGIVNTRDGQGHFIFSETATHAFTSDQSHVNGSVEKLGVPFFMYPVGHDNFYRPISIDPTQADALYSVAFYHRDPTALFNYTVVEHGIKAVDNREYWLIDKEFNDQVNPLIGLSWDSQTTPPKYIEAAQNNQLVIVRWNPNEQRWNNKGGVIDINANTVTSRIEQTGIVTFGIEKARDCTLEVFNLIDVTGKTNNEYLRIEDDKSCSKITEVIVFNRWGVKVFETNNYGSNGDVFNGYSSGRMSIDRNHPLPAGTYFYIINYRNRRGSDPTGRQKTGYLYILDK